LAEQVKILQHEGANRGGWSFGEIFHFTDQMGLTTVIRIATVIFVNPN
jgi:hypothetical protein